MSDIQLKGSLTIGALDVKSLVSSLVIKRTRSAVTVPPTLGNIREVEKAGALKESIEINFFSSMAAADFWALLYAAIDTETAEVAFTGLRFENAVKGTDNPEFSGSFAVLGVDTGADVGTLRQQTQTYPITAAGITKATS